MNQSFVEYLDRTASYIVAPIVTFLLSTPTTKRNLMKTVVDDIHYSFSIREVENDNVLSAKFSVKLVDYLSL